MTETNLVRLQKYLAEAGIASRRASEQLILEGRVRVNGEIVKELGTKVDRKRDRIEFDGRVLSIEPKRLFLFHKPRNVVTTLSDPEKRPCVGDYLGGVKERVYPVGRLDFDVTGILLLTNDGEFADTMMHPRNEVARVYHAKVAGKPTIKQLQTLKDGVQLEDGPGRADDAFFLSARAKSPLSAKDNTQIIQLVVSEGRNHFVKNLFAAIDCPIVELARVAFGPYQLGDLKVGELREIRIFES